MLVRFDAVLKPSSFIESTEWKFPDEQNPVNLGVVTFGSQTLRLHLFAADNQCSTFPHSCELGCTDIPEKLNSTERIEAVGIAERSCPLLGKSCDICPPLRPLKNQKLTDDITSGSRISIMVDIWKLCIKDWTHSIWMQHAMRARCTPRQTTSNYYAFFL